MLSLMFDATGKSAYGMTVKGRCQVIESLVVLDS
ncbi:hypothetical protein NMY3_02972 [Candidatus Nitrosocosmicus oleophilus]|uniref:Uncharacterized protein n=1 Tax=Candidatus Nitrosocosmicus oleophilus TaxID=1353260 RepID=A0A654M3X8_9ARCH|nr:hypothetical protein NMY3_02972 [Candidatus Nitrosocosmicus oleophilus]